MPSSERAVVLMKGFLGDAVMATPLLEGLRAKMSTTVVAPPVIGTLLGEEWSDAFIAVEGGGFLARVRAVRAAQADVALLLNRSFRSALVARVAGVRVRVGHATESRGFLLTRRIPFDSGRHEIEAALDLARAIGTEIAPTNPLLRVTDAELERGRKLINGATLALQPGARHKYKRIGLDTLVQLVPLLLSAGFSPVLIGGADETAAAAALQAVFPSLPNLVGKCTLRETLGVLAASRLAIGADTGIMHIAAAVSCPTVTVFGPTEYSTRWGHLYEPHQVLQAGPEGMQCVSADEILAAAKTAVEQASAVTPRITP